MQSHLLASNTKNRNVALLLLLVYVYSTVATPQVRFDFLGEIHFEKLIIIGSIIALIARGKLTWKKSPIITIAIIFFLWVLFTSILSPYRGSPLNIHWQDTYWKLIIALLLISLAINTTHDLKVYFCSLCIIAFLYEIHTLLDYIQGGSYVYQQGLKRMVGIWSGGGFGAANAWGLLSIFFFPFGTFWMRNTSNKKIKLAMLLFQGLSVACAVLSGSRAAMICIGFLIVLIYKTKLLSVKAILVYIILSTAIYPSIPDSIKHRYVGFLYSEYELQRTDQERRFDIVSKESAESRLEGLYDGWRLMKQRPLTGYGPGASAYARRYVGTVGPETWRRDHRYLQLHNLYGQIISETGIIGALIFSSLIFIYFSRLNVIARTIAKQCNSADHFLPYLQTLKYSMLTYLLFGMSAHTLYRYHWIILLPALVALDNLVKNFANADATPSTVTHYR